MVTFFILLYILFIECNVSPILCEESKVIDPILKNKVVDQGGNIKTLYDNMAKHNKFTIWLYCLLFQNIEVTNESLDFVDKFYTNAYNFAFKTTSSSLYFIYFTFLSFVFYKGYYFFFNSKKNNILLEETDMELKLLKKSLSTLSNQVDSLIIQLEYYQYYINILIIIIFILIIIIIILLILLYKINQLKK